LLSAPLVENGADPDNPVTSQYLLLSAPLVENGANPDNPVTSQYLAMYHYPA